MADYLFCQKKRNTPRISVRICQEKCSFKDECKEYLAHIKESVPGNRISVSLENTSIAQANC